MSTTKQEMLEYHLKGRGVTDPAVLRAMDEVDRGLFVPEEMRSQAYEDCPLPIGGGQTISQPYIVGYMAQALGLGEDDTVLECGAGCGYNAAVLSRIARQVYTVEILPELAEGARRNLEKAGIGNVEVRAGDAFQGWPEKAPFDAIVLTAAPAAVPEPLAEQLRVGGRLLAPVGVGTQDLTLVTRVDEEHFREKPLLPVRFVPMTGKAGEPG
ncbi:MAG: protein-L-isoaspartate(D-aspartate) O-methyltransferase [Puniceicoccaceae bacterium]